MAGQLNPAVAAALLAIAAGADTVEKLAEALRLTREDSEALVERMEAEGLVRREKRGLILKRERLRLTSRGLELLPRARELLRGAAEEARRRMEEGRPLGELEPLIPVMAALGFLDMALLGMLMPLAAASSLVISGEQGEDTDSAGEDGGDTGDVGDLDAGD